MVERNIKEKMSPSPRMLSKVAAVFVLLAFLQSVCCAVPNSKIKNTVPFLALILVPTCFGSLIKAFFMLPLSEILNSTFNLYKNMRLANKAYYAEKIAASLFVKYFNYT